MDSVSKQQKEPPKVYVTFEGPDEGPGDGKLIGAYSNLENAKQDLYSRALSSIGVWHSVVCTKSGRDPEDCDCDESRSHADKIFQGPTMIQELFWCRAGTLLLIKQAPIWNCPQEPTNKEAL